MALTEAQKLAFAKFMKEVLKENKAVIAAAKPNVSYDVDGNVREIESKEAAYDGEEGKVTALDALKQEQVKKANEKLKDLYNASSNVADGVVGHIGKDHKLAQLIRQKRDSMSQNGGSNTPPPAKP